MALNLVRGFRRIGWVLALPLAALIVLAFFEFTKEWVVEVPGRGTVFVGTVPADVWDALKASTTKEEFKASFDKLPLPQEIKADLWEKFAGGEVSGVSFFTVHNKVSKLRLLGLLVGSVAAAALFIQGSISVLAWVSGGFKG